mmetsp:Transcript_97097/g.312930  ORF Transcript_97097/g.312930 Transcript_97097/m.312930 type:complete len:320 (+) Transcript_97097:721-1680(+)
MPSRVGRPSRSKPTPSGIGSPRCEANRSLPREVTVVDMSSTNGCSEPEGAPAAKGLAPNKASLSDNLLRSSRGGLGAAMGRQRWRRVREDQTQHIRLQGLQHVVRRATEVRRTSDAGQAQPLFLREQDSLLRGPSCHHEPHAVVAVHQRRGRGGPLHPHLWCGIDDPGPDALAINGQALDAMACLRPQIRMHEAARDQRRIPGRKAHGLEGRLTEGAELLRGPACMARAGRCNRSGSGGAASDSRREARQVRSTETVAEIRGCRYALFPHDRVRRKEGERGQVNRRVLEEFTLRGLSQNSYGHPISGYTPMSGCRSVVS